MDPDTHDSVFGLMLLGSVGTILVCIGLLFGWLIALLVAGLIVFTCCLLEANR